MTVLPPGSGHTAREAVTELTLLESFPGFSLVEAKLQTGRTHQIRVHCAYIGHPVVGDATYGPANPRDESAAQHVRAAIAALEGQALHAHSLAFHHPRTGQRMDFVAAPPADTAGLIEALHR